MQIPETLATYVTPSSQTAKAGGSVMGKDDFLKLLVTQLQYQDPENPLDNKEFSAQLAQFSSLEQMYKISEGFEKLSTLLSQQGQYSLLQAVGKTARAPGDSLVAAPTGSGSIGGFTLSGPSAATTVSVTDANGAVLRKIDLGALSSGDHTFTWDGTLSNGANAPAGSYRFTVAAVDGSGKSVAATSFIEGKVTGMSFTGVPAVYIGGIAVPLSTITLWKGGDNV
jgi:flagellar basal-body rod modification protein FlgD